MIDFQHGNYEVLKVIFQTAFQNTAGWTKYFVCVNMFNPVILRLGNINSIYYY